MMRPGPFWVLQLPVPAVKHGVSNATLEVRFMAKKSSIEKKQAPYQLVKQ